MFSKEALNARIREYFEYADLHAAYDESRDVYLMLTSCSSKVGTLVIKMIVKDDLIIVIATCPTKVDTNDAEAMRRVAEYLHRATYGMKIGSFDFDFNDGEAQFRTSLLVKDALPSNDMLGMLLATGPSMWTRYGDGFFNVAFMGADPKEAAESSSNEGLIALLESVLASKRAAEAAQAEGASDDEAA